MKQFILTLSAAGLAVVILSCMSSSQKKVNNVVINKAGNRGFVLMELFTSQGCSSCPPADELLGKYAMQNDPQIIPIAFHVDYWNRLGWTDTFSSSKFTQRQNEYASVFNGESVYTPQLVINGQKEMVGSDADKIANTLNDFLKHETTASVKIGNILASGNKINVDYTLNETASNTNLQVALVQQQAVTHIKAGENRGEKLTGYNVVRDFVSLPAKATNGTATLQLPAGNNAKDFSIVIYLQDKDSYKITAAAIKKIE